MEETHMVQENNPYRRFALYEEMRQFFRELPSHYILGEEEQVELVWMPRGKNQPTHRECFPDLEQASARAVSLGPSHDVFLQAVIEPGTTPWETESTQLLACWHDVREKCGPTGVSTLVALPYDEPSQKWYQYYSGGGYTCIAVWFYYRSRCPIRARLRGEQQTPSDEGGQEL
jgi:hypothetical protein